MDGDVKNLTNPEGDIALDLTRRGAMGAALFTAGFAASMQPANAQAIVTDDKGLVIREITFKGAGGYDLPAFVAHPETKSPRPAIIVVNEIFGIHAYIKDVCKRFAKAGFVAIAPDYFDRGGDPAVLSDMKEVRAIVAKAEQEQVLEDTAGAIAWLKAQSFVQAGKLSITGFCWGGNVTWMAASRFADLKAGVAWYGRLARPKAQNPGGDNRPYPVDAAKDLKAPVLGLYAQNDGGIPLTDVKAMEDALSAAGNPTGSRFIVFHGTEHGFHADYRKQYNKEAAETAWAQALKWLKDKGAA